MVSVSENCIYLTHEDSQIWIDYGGDGGYRDLYFYKNNKLIFVAFFTFSNGLLLLRNKYNLFENQFCWDYEKMNEFSIKINNSIYYIDKNNESQNKLFNEFLKI
jgi:hypothetical protein